MIAVLDIANAAVAIVLLGLAAAAIAGAANLVRRVIALFLALLGGILAASALHADGGLIVAGVGIAAAYAAIGVALLVRVQETYRSVEVDELDAADLSDEPVEPRA